MQRFWCVISTTFLIEYHSFLLYWIEYSFPSILTPSSSSMDTAFWFYGYFSETVSFSKCDTFPPASRLEAAGIFSSDGVPLNQLCRQKHNCPHFEKEDSMNETEAFITQLCGTIIGIVPQMNASVSFMLSSFSKWGQLCFYQHNGTPTDEKNWHYGSKSLHSFWATLYSWGGAFWGVCQTQPTNYHVCQ